MLDILRIARLTAAARLDGERGATAVEYGLMVALIAVAIIGIVFTLGQTLDGQFTTTNECIASANAANPNCP